MTSPQLRILSYIADATAANGYPPTVREIARGCGIPRSCAQRLLDQLEADGAITRNFGAMRTIRVVGDGTSVPAADVDNVEPSGLECV